MTKKEPKIKLVKPKRIKLTEQEVAKIVIRYKAIQVEENRLKAEKEELRDLLKGDMKLKNLESLDIEDIHVTYSEFLRENFDSKTFKLENPELAKKYLYTTQQELVVVK